MNRARLAVTMLLFSTTCALAQTFDLALLNVLNDGTHYDVSVLVKSNTSTFRMGSSNLVFFYNTAGLSSPTLTTVTNFGGGPYNTMSLTQPATNKVSLNIELLGLNNGTTVTASFMSVATVRFTILNAGQTAGISWNTLAPNRTAVFNDVGPVPAEIPAGILNGLSGPLPVQISSFSGTVINIQGHVRVNWTTLTETNNYGFEVQKSPNAPNRYSTIPGSFVPGNGTTLEPHHYSYTDVTGMSGTTYYRLRQIDFDGSDHFTEGIVPTNLTGVKEKEIPTSFTMDQNYPNPFNPSTQIRFGVPAQSRVVLDVYNLIGQKVATLVDEVKSAGYYTVPFSAERLASGVYFYKLTAGETKFLKKMILMR